MKKARILFPALPFHLDMFEKEESSQAYCFQEWLLAYLHGEAGRLQHPSEWKHPCAVLGTGEIRLK